MENDAAIQSLFASAEQQLDGDHFTAEVVNKTRVLKYRVIAAIALLALCMAIVVWFFDVPFEIARLLAAFLTNPLVDIGEGWLAWGVSPVNNIASLILIAAKLLRVAWKRFLGAYYLN